MYSALGDVVVLDLSTDIAGSHTCMLLGDMGAQIIKVELADSPEWRGALPFHLWNRGKRSICLDLDKEGGREALEALIRGADVAVEDYIYPEARARGLDYERLAPSNPRLVYCSLPPFGDEGPLSARPANDGVVAAFSAIMGDQNGPGKPPEYITVPGPSCGAAFLAACAICSALYVRETEGVGQKVEVPLLSGALTMQGGSFVTGPNITDVEGRPGKDPQGVKPPYRLYQCSDGKWIFIACGNNTFWNRLCLALEMEEFATNPRMERAPWFFEDADHHLVKATIARKIQEHPQAYWLELLDRHDVPVAPADTREDFVEDPQVVYDNMMIRVEDPLFGLTRQLGFAVSVADAPGSIPSMVPGRGQHGMEILRGLGYTDAQCQRLQRSGALIC